MKSKKPPQAKGGIKAAAEMLGGLDAETRNRLLVNLAKRDPQVAIEIEKQLFVFEDLLRLSDSSLQVLLKEIPLSKLALALRKTSSEIKEFIKRNLSEQQQQMLREEMDAQGLRKVSQ